jgi:hypothetical protein
VAYYNPRTGEVEYQDQESGVGSMIGGLGAEVGIAGASQALGAATGIGYIPIAFSGGFAGSLANQAINDEPINLGRAIAAGMVNLLPGAAGIKAASKAGKVTKLLDSAAKGLNRYGHKTIPGAIRREAFRGSALGVSEITVENLINDADLPSIDEVLQYGAGGAAFGGLFGGILGNLIQKSLGKNLDDASETIIDGLQESWSTMGLSRKRELLDAMKLNINDKAVNVTPQQRALLPARLSVSEDEMDKEFNKLLNLGRKSVASEMALKALILARDPTTGADVYQANAFTKFMKKVAPSTIFGRELTNRIDEIQGVVKEAESLGSRIRKEVKLELQRNPDSTVMDDIRNYVTSPHEAGEFVQEAGTKQLQHRAGSSMGGEFVRKAKLPTYLSRLEPDLDQWKVTRSRLQNELLEFVDPKTIDGFVGGEEALAIRAILDEVGGDMSNKSSIIDSMRLQNYLTTEYRLFDDAKYVPSKESKEKLISWLVKNDRNIKNSTFTDSLTGKEIKDSGEIALRKRQKAEELLNRKYLTRAANPKARVSFPAKTVGEVEEFMTSDILLDKKEALPKVLVDFLGGEIINPLTGKADTAEQMFGTIMKLSKRIAGLRTQEVLLRDLQQQGKLNVLSIGGVRQNVPQIPFENAKQVSLFGGNVVIEAPKEVVDSMLEISHSGLAHNVADKAIDATNAFVKQFQDLYGTSVGASKAVKVIASPIAYATNAMGGAIAAMASGNFNLMGKDVMNGIRMSLDEFGNIEGVAEAFGKTVSKAGRAGLKSKQMQLLLDDIGKMRKYGMMGADVSTADTVRALGDGSIGKWANQVFDPLSKAYQVTDNAFRYVVWKGNIDKIKKIFPKPSGMSDGRYLAEVERASAFLTNDTYQNYNKLSETFKKASSIGLAPPFSAFTAELYRNTFNNVRTIVKMGKGTFGDDLGLSQELLSNANRSAMLGEGVKRFAILGTLSAGFGYAVKHYNEANGVDSEKMEALKNTVIPPYDRDKDLIINMNPDGKSGTYINASYINPFSEFNSIANAALSGKGTVNSIKDVAAILADRFIGEGSFVFQGLGSVTRNQDEYGNPISLKEDGLGRGYDRATYFLKEVFTPSAIGELDKWVETLNGTGDYTENQLVLRLMGVRQTSFNVDDDTKWQIRPSNENMRLIKGRYNSLDENTPEDVRQRAYQQANQNRDASMGKLMTVYDSLKTLGVSDDEAIKIFKDSNVSNSDVIQISQNKTQPIDYVKATTISDAYEAIEGSTVSETRRNILANTKGNIKLRKALLSKLRQEQTYTRRNISEFDKSLLSLGVPERAQMLMDILGVGATNSVLVNEYRRKGIITDDVMKAMRLRGSLSSY